MPAGRIRKFTGKPKLHERIAHSIINRARTVGVYGIRPRKQLFSNIRKSKNKPIDGGVFNPPRPVIQRTPNPFGNTMLVKMHYGHMTGLTANGLTTASRVTYRLNSLFDPDQTGVGHQPYQYDQLNLIYQRSLVYAAAVKLEWNNPSADGLYCGYNIRGPDTKGVNGDTMDTLLERPNAKAIAINNSGKQVVTQNIYVPLHKLNGKSKVSFMADTDNYSEPTGGPAITKQNQVEVWVLDSTGGTANVNVRISITYYALMYDLITQNPS